MQIEDFEALLNSRIIAAFSLGMSVVEITRILRKSSVEYVHGLLRETGYIQAMPKSDFRRSYDIDCSIEAALRKKGYSFARWCLGWKFDPNQAEAALRTRPGNGQPVPVHEALRHDFPEVYVRIFGGSSPKKEAKISSPPFHPSVAITWDSTRNGYVARIAEHPEIEAVGGDWDQAFERLKTAHRTHESICRLNGAIEKRRGVSSP
ncbi:MAG TPA: hypothetical protein VI298_16110 [Geobacteraceae bacterium]